MNTVARAHGHWPEILAMLGVDQRYLVNKHGPCPICGGRDRYRFDNRDGSGSYYCHQCGAGSGLILLRKLRNWGYREACEMVDAILAQLGDAPAQAEPKTDIEKIRASIVRVINAASYPNVVEAELARRGISVRSRELLGHRSLDYFNEKRERVGEFPAVIAPVTAPDGEVISAHRIYCHDIAPRKKLMRPTRKITGAAVRLHAPDGGVLGVSEGIETGLAAYQLHGVPTWAALTELGVQTFEVPEGVRELHIFGDNDENWVGQFAAAALAKRVASKGVKAFVHIPPEPGTDWLDELNRIEGRA